MKLKHRSFTDTKKFVQQLGLKNKNEWLRFINSGTIPPDIPKDPPSAYKKSWVSWGDFLGSGKISYRPSLTKMNESWKKGSERERKEWEKQERDHEAWRREQARSRWRRRMMERREKPEFYDEIRDLRSEKKWKEVLKITKPIVKSARLVGDEPRPKKDHFYLRVHADTLYFLKKYKESLPYAIEVTRKDPENESSWARLASNYERLAQDSEALSAIETALEIDTSDAQLWYNKACLLARNNKKDEALRSLLIAAALGKDEVILDMRTDKDFKKIKNDPKFKKLVSSHWKDLF